jgi:hypothetical protein
MRENMSENSQVQEQAVITSKGWFVSVILGLQFVILAVFGILCAMNPRINTVPFTIVMVPALAIAGIFIIRTIYLRLRKSPKSLPFIVWNFAALILLEIGIWISRFQQAGISVVAQGGMHAKEYIMPPVFDVAVFIILLVQAKRLSNQLPKEQKKMSLLEKALTLFHIISISFLTIVAYSAVYSIGF